MQQTITTLRSEVRLLRKTYSGLAPLIRDGFGTLANETGDGALDLAPELFPTHLGPKVRDLNDQCRSRRSLGACKT
jgi:hypothetical protein